MHKLLIAFLALCSSTMLLAQTNEKAGKPSTGHTSFYAEMGGPGILFSANIDKRFKNSNLGWGGRIGLGFVSGYILPDTGIYYYNNNQSSVVTVPVQINHVFGKPNSPHTFEVGAGLTVTGKKIDIFNNYNYNDPNKGTSFYGTASFMYRRQPIDGGFMWRIGFTPIISKGFIQPSGGVSVGYSF
jgi:hypothetical protein